MEKNCFEENRTPNMNDYYKVSFVINPANVDAADLIAASLADAGFESFSHDETEPGASLDAFVPAPLYVPEVVNEAIDECPIAANVQWSAEFVPRQDWNAEWEKNYFKPIVIADRVVVHSSFHTDIPRAEYDIVIDPKMAFGTGHHATTTLMMHFILQNEMQGASVLDMGTGTGILGILATLRGAAHVTGIEIDPAAAANAVENVELNLHDHKAVMKIIHGDASHIGPNAFADYVLANINRNIITADIEHYARALKHGGLLAVSGFYTEDRPVVEAAARKAGLTLRNCSQIDNWSSMIFFKP